VKGIQVCSIKGPGPLQRGDNHNDIKMGWGHLKIFFFRTMKPEKLNFTWKLPDLEWRQVGQNDGPWGSDGANGNEMHIWYWKNISIWAKVSQVSDVAHGPLVCGSDYLHQWCSCGCTFIFNWISSLWLELRARTIDLHHPLSWGLLICLHPRSYHCPWALL
jgi:hypothetical protein